MSMQKSENILANTIISGAPVFQGTTGKASLPKRFIPFMSMFRRHPSMIFVREYWQPGGRIVKPPLTDPITYGGKPEDVFDVVIPSMPGYGFSVKPNTTGFGCDRIGKAWDILMKRLGYAYYVSAGNDWVQ